MKIVAAISAHRMLVEVSCEELSTLTEWKGGNKWSGVSTEAIESGKSYDLMKEFKDAKSLLESFRGIVPNLRKASALIERMACEIEGHEPNESLKKKETA